MLPRDQLGREGVEGEFGKLADVWDGEYGVDKSVARSFRLDVGESPIGKNKSVHVMNDGDDDNDGD